MRFLRLFALLSLLGVVVRARAEQEVGAREPFPIGIVLRDGVVGGLVGSAVAGGLAGYSLGLQGRSGFEWGRTLAWGAGLGVGAGLVLGMVAGARSRAAPQGPVRDGLSRSLDARARDQSHSHLFPLLSRTF